MSLPDLSGFGSALNLFAGPAVPLLIATLVGLVAGLLGYQLLFRQRALSSASEKRLATAFTVADEDDRVVDPKSAEFKLAQAGIKAANPPVALAMIQYGPALAAFIVGMGLALPIVMTIAIALIAFIAPAQWLSNKAKDRSKELEADLPQVYIELMATLQANPDVPNALLEIAAGIERAKGRRPINEELRQTAREALSAQVGRIQAYRNLQGRSASISLANLALLIERYEQTGAGAGGSFFAAFRDGAENVQTILEARMRSKAKAQENMMAAWMIPAIMAFALLFFMQDPTFGMSFTYPMVQLGLGAAVIIMYVGFMVMSDIVREAA